VQCTWSRLVGLTAVRTCPPAPVEAVRSEVVRGLVRVREVLDEPCRRSGVKVGEALPATRHRGQFRAAANGTGWAPGLPARPVGHPCLPLMPAPGASPADPVVTRGRQIRCAELGPPDRGHELFGDLRVFRLQAPRPRPRSQASPAHVRSCPRRRLLGGCGDARPHVGAVVLQRLENGRGPQPGIAFRRTGEEDLLSGPSALDRQPPELSWAHPHVSLTGQPVQLAGVALHGRGGPVPTRRVKVDKQVRRVDEEVDALITRAAAP